MLAQASVASELTSIARALIPRFRKIVGDRLELSVICDHDPCYVAAPHSILERFMLGLVSAARSRQRRGGFVLLEIASVPKSASDRPTVTDLAVLTLSASTPWTDSPTTHEPNGRPLVGLPALMEDIRAMAGHCTVETEPDGAETVCVFLPLLESRTRAPLPRVELRIHRPGFRVRVATLLRGAGFDVQAVPSARPAQQADIILCDLSDPVPTVEANEETGTWPTAPLVVPISGGSSRMGSPRFTLHEPLQDQQPRMLDAVEFVAQVKHLARKASHRFARTRPPHA